MVIKVKLRTKRTENKKVENLKSIRFSTFFMRVICLEFSPGISAEQDKHRIEFQTSGQHIKDQDDF